MLTLGPVSDREMVKSIFNEKNIPYNENSQCVSCADVEEILGFCLFDLEKDKITVKYIEPVTDIALADGILRSSLHVAAERSITAAYYDDTVPEDFLQSVKFIKNKNEKTLNIDKLFESCCNCE